MSNQPNSVNPEAVVDIVRSGRRKAPRLFVGLRYYVLRVWYWNSPYRLLKLKIERGQVLLSRVVLKSLRPMMKAFAGLKIGGDE